MRDSTSRWTWVLLVVFAGCSRCNDTCEDECFTYDPTTDTGSSEDSGSGGSASQTSGEIATADDATDPGTTSSSTGMIDDGQCQGTDECAGAFCVAPYADNVRGLFACVDECVGPMDEAKWCFDDAACCDPAAHCTIRGYCEVEGDGTTTSGGESTSGTGGSSSGG